MTDEHAAQIVRAIREHTRAVVAERLWAQAEAGTDVDLVVADADALLAALAASGGGESGGTERRAEPVAPGAPNELTATPPPSADLVTVRRDDLAWAIDWIDTDDPGACQRRQRLLDYLR